MNLYPIVEQLQICSIDGGKPSLTKLTPFAKCDYICLKSNNSQSIEATAKKVHFWKHEGLFFQMIIRIRIRIGIFCNLGHRPLLHKLYNSLSYTIISYHHTIFSVTLHLYRHWRGYNLFMHYITPTVDKYIYIHKNGFSSK